MSDDIKRQTMDVALLLSRHETLMIEEQNKTRAVVSDLIKRLDSQFVADDAIPIDIEKPRLDFQRDETKIRSKVATLLLESLQYSSMDDREGEIADACHETFEWIYEDGPSGPAISSRFSDWLQRGNGIYWINGKAGSGKSTLMRFLYHHEQTRSLLIKWASPMPVSIARFYFWNSGTPEQRSQVGLLRSLLYNVLHAHRELIPIVLPSEWATWYSSTVEVENPLVRVRWNLSNLKHAVRLLLNQNTSPLKLCLFIDGLDEYDGDHEEMANFFQSLSYSPNVKLCVSSRPWLAFIDAFRGCPSLRLQDLTLRDIERYVTEKFERNPRYRRLVDEEPEEAPALVAQIVSRADGVFLWVVLVVKSLLEGLRNRDGIVDLQKRLAMLPSNLEDLYRQMISRIGPFYQRRASEIFQIFRANWMMTNYLDRLTKEPLLSHFVSFEPLTVLLLSFGIEDKPDAVFKQKIEPITPKALSKRCETMADRLKVWTAGLLDMQGSENAHGEGSGGFIPEPQAKIQYLHRTVRDFLEEKHEWDRIMARTEGTDFEPYTALLSASILELKVSSGDIEQLWDMACSHLTLATHADFVTNRANTKLLEEFDRVMRFHFQSWCRTHATHWGNYINLDSDINDWHESFLSLAVQFSLCKYVEEKLKSNRSLLINSNGRPLLDFAVNPVPASRDLPVSPKIVQVLLQNGADPNVKFCNQTAWDQALRWYNATNPSRETTCEVSRYEKRHNIHSRDSSPDAELCNNILEELYSFDQPPNMDHQDQCNPPDVGNDATSHVSQGGNDSDSGRSTTSGTRLPNEGQSASSSKQNLQVESADGTASLTNPSPSTPRFPNPVETSVRSNIRDDPHGSEINEKELPRTRVRSWVFPGEKLVWKEICLLLNPESFASLSQG